MNYRNIALESNIGKSLFKEKEEQCVFISHKKEDEQAAIDIGRYLTDVVGVHIYLDFLDDKLQKATQIENDQVIVDSIKEGLKYSTHLLCLISDKTRLSWWVPYEIGVADDKNLKIASLKLNKTDDIPSYLKVHPAFYNVNQFVEYTSTYKKYGQIFYEKSYRNLSACTDLLKKHIEY